MASPDAFTLITGSAFAVLTVVSLAPVVAAVFEDLGKPGHVPLPEPHHPYTARNICRGGGSLDF
ncbi:MAG: hypothetical protein AB7G06_03925 [Bdellovibrionales bacterium]